MLTLPLNRILFRSLVSLSSVLLGLSAAIVLLLWVGHAPHKAQAADSPLPTGDYSPRSEAEREGSGVRAMAQESNINPASLTSSPAQTLTGEIADIDFGYPVATAGDVNGDGYADVIVGAYLYNNGTGRAYLYLGSANGLSATPAFTATGEGPVNAFGFAAATAGDINGDGYADVIIGANGYSNSNGRGRIYLYLGSASGLNIMPALTVTGEPGSDFGISARTAGDVNGDGYADVIVGAPNSPAGHAYLYLGSASGLSTTPAFTGTGEMNAYGISAGTAGDVNGDGYADVIVGEFRTGDTGRAYLYLGSASGLSATPALTMTGEASGDYFGYSVGTAGDVNGDGYADVIVGAHKYNNFTGRVYVYLGSANGLSATPTFTATGEAVNDRLGFPAATSGDVNGDGYADIIIGASGNYSSTGRAYVYLGSASGLKTTPALTVTGEMTNDQLGISVGTAGDVNGDGYADFIVGAIGYNNYTGRAYVYHGAADAPGSTPVFTLTGQTGDALGGRVGTAGDVNGDGYADVIIGAGGASGGKGQAYIYPGSASGLNSTPILTVTGEMTNIAFGTGGTTGDVNGDGYADFIVGAHAYNNYTGRAYLYLGGANNLNAAPTLTLTGDAANSFFGYPARTAGDVNGDGYGDVFVGAYLASRAYIYLGSASGLNPTPAFTLTGNAPNQAFGAAGGTAGDVNGDGYDDVIVGEIGYITTTGRAYVYLGGPNGLNTTPSFTATGEGPDNFFGWSAGTAGDMNGDGYADILITALGYNGETGRAYIYLGGVNSLSATPALTITGEGLGDSFGWSAEIAGDMNGDGYADIIIGADIDSPSPRIGRAHVYFGGPSGLSDVPTIILTGELTDTNFAVSVGTAGDVNGDGYAEIIVGAPDYGGNPNAPGRAYIYTSNGGYGLSLNPRQRRSDDSEPIAHGGQSDSATSFRLTALGRSPFGRGKVKLEWEVKPLGTPFDGAGTQQSANWLDSGTAGAAFNELVTGLSANTVYHWRVRVRYHPASTPFQQYSRWFTQPWNGWQEADLRTATAANVPPVAANDVYTVTRNLSLTVAAPGVLANDTDSDGPALLTAIPFTQPLTGSLAFNSEGSFVYTPTLDFMGVVTFTYHANDGAANSNLATATITVAPGFQLYLPLVVR